MTSVKAVSQQCPGYAAENANRPTVFRRMKKVFSQSVDSMSAGVSSCIRYLKGAVKHCETTAEDKIASQIAGSATSLQEESLTDDAKQLIHEAFAGIDPKNVLDYHSHIISLVEKNGWVNPQMMNSLQGKIYLESALGSAAKKISEMTSEEISNAYINRFVSFVRNFRDLKQEDNKSHARVAAFAFDYRYDAQKNPDQKHSTFWVSNDYVFELAKQYPDVFFPVISINPNKGVEKAINELEEQHKKFVEWRSGQGDLDHVPFMMKWLPNAMGINPKDPTFDPFYQKMKELNCVLLSHTGHEKAVHGEEFQKLGNSQLLTKVNELGIKVIHAHCGSLGTNKDEVSGKESENTDITINVLKKKNGHYGDISALTQFNRVGKICTIAKKIDQSQLVYGSDYPLPTINALIPLFPFWMKGMITRKEMNSLREIFKFNPLLFDFVLKRTMRHPQQGWLSKLFGSQDPYAGKKVFEARVFDSSKHTIMGSISRS